MCGRFTLSANPEAVGDLFGIPAPADLTPRYNVAPSQLIPVVGLKKDGVTRGMLRVRWGLIPSYSNGPVGAPMLNNVRGESVDFKFRDVFRQKRCLVPADGFYEWSGKKGAKQPHWFRMTDGAPFGLAAVWDIWGEGAGRVVSCALITTSPNGVVKPFHDRMPVIVPPADFTAWLDPETDVRTLTGMLKPYAAGEMTETAVSTAVNKAANDGPECVAPAA